ncbi:glycosyl hydrolase family 18 protein [Catellatospora sp. KI3]|uniref:glycoside hydrolase family 18 protein n=1 Tax=Catellatospora sp. KI3 TaxID=3041620 RepID=UPI0024824022|nr:glycosyl hydrolase family 18 protein [Catellatospora sp. KI3]MDI1460932.1 glycosyl hydrolase family 18 protein [Catellatospora sp. KI3]
MITERTVLGAYFHGTDEAYRVDARAAGLLTHVFYAFATIEDGQPVLPSRAPEHLATLAELKRANPRLRVVLSVGGWGADGFSDAALTPGSRAAFAARCLDLAVDFDGLDLDWEFPVAGGPAEVVHRPEDRANLTLLARELRRELGPDRLLTAALPAGRLQAAGPYDPADSYELAALAEVLDFVNLMTYDFGTGFSPVATFNAPLAEVAQDPLAPELRRWNHVTGAVEYFESHGVPRDKLVLGVPFYGRGFHVAAAGEQAGLYQPQVGDYYAGDWRDIRRDLLADPAWQVHRHPVARSPWLFHPGTQTFVSYEDADSIQERSAYAARAGLRGAFTWHLAGDDDENTLLAAMTRPFQP